ncbi:MAG: FAD-binding oxidoreductase [bacterium]|nr:FAD-binding oxidoreductase [bacterium]
MLTDELKKIIKGEVTDDEAMLKKHSRDASLFEISPSVVVSPKDSADIQALVNFVADQKDIDKGLSLTARSGGTDMTGGPLTTSISMEMTRHFNQIIDVTPESATVQPGVYYRDLDRETKRQDRMMPAYPASREICTVGGMVGNNSGGEKTLSYGKVENYLLELKVVLSDGKEYVIKPLSRKDLEIKMKLRTFEGKLYKQIYELIKNNQKIITAAKPNVSKNSAGYYLWNVLDPKTGAFDLARLIVGSQGTLGIVTEIKFRLVPVKKISKMLVIFMKDLSRLGDIVVELLKHKPEALESYDDKTLKLALKFFPEMIKILKPKHILSMMWHLLPEVGMVLTGGMPKLVIMAEFTGDADTELDARMRAAEEAMPQFKVKTRITKTEEEEREFWVIRRESFNLLRNKVQGKQTAPFIDDFIVRPEHLPEFLPKLNAILDKYDLIYTIAGHPGDGNFHIIPLMNLADDTQRAIIPKLADEVYDLVLAYKGSITAEHNDGLMRTPYLEKMYGPEVYALFGEIKKIFDPQNIFNPGKKVGFVPGYALTHIKHG